MTFTAPDIDYAGLSPRHRADRRALRRPAGRPGRPRRSGSSSRSLTLATLATTAGLCIWQWGESKDLVAGALRLDDLAIAISLIGHRRGRLRRAALLARAGGRAARREPRHGEFQALLLGSVLGMVLLAQAQNLVSFFVALELLSIPLYVLCGAALPPPRVARVGAQVPDRRLARLGDAALRDGVHLRRLGLDRLRRDRRRDRRPALADDPLVLIGIALCATGLAFKISIAPFHQWTPDVYQGAPTPVTAFMAVATKAAAFAVFAPLLRRRPRRRRSTTGHRRSPRSPRSRSSSATSARSARTR